MLPKNFEQPNRLWTQSFPLSIHVKEFWNNLKRTSKGYISHNSNLLFHCALLLQELLLVHFRAWFVSKSSPHPSRVLGKQFGQKNSHLVAKAWHPKKIVITWTFWELSWKLEKKTPFQCVLSIWRQTVYSFHILVKIIFILWELDQILLITINATQLPKL